MREIKFRIWDVENKEMLKVQELDFEPTFYGGRIAIRPDQYNDYFDTEDMILMQYTGLKDITGKEIYEGDIVKLKFMKNSLDIIVKVEYSEEYAQYVVAGTKSILHECEPLTDYQEIEVIGNIWDNPELMEEE